MENKMIYSFGVRDGIAYVLMEAKADNIKLPKIAMDYEKNFGEHPTLKWHMEAMEGEKKDGCVGSANPVVSEEKA